MTSIKMNVHRISNQNIKVDFRSAHTRERIHIARSNCQHFHSSATKPTGEVLQLPPSKLKMPRRSEIGMNKTNMHICYSCNVTEIL